MNSIPYTKITSSELNWISRIIDLIVFNALTDMVIIKRKPVMSRPRIQNAIDYSRMGESLTGEFFFFLNVPLTHLIHDQKDANQDVKPET